MIVVVVIVVIDVIEQIKLINTGRALTFLYFQKPSTLGFSRSGFSNLNILWKLVLAIKCAGEHWDVRQFLF
jgi:hypothetical protein